MAAEGTFANPFEAVYVDELTVTDPDSGLPVELEVWKDPASGAMFAVDASFMDQVDDVICSPFNRDVYLHLSEAAIERATPRAK